MADGSGDIWRGYDVPAGPPGFALVPAAVEPGAVISGDVAPADIAVAAYPLEIDDRPLATARDVATFLEESYGGLIYALYRAPPAAQYTHFDIPKRTGGTRRISSPIGAIRRCQDKLYPVLQGVYRAHPAAHGFIAERSVVTNAGAHVGRRWVLNVDLQDFFPSINFGRVRGLFMAPPFSLGAAAATVLAQICTYENGLPQGASTSPVLSNFAASELDRRLLRLARENRLHYSRYADDLTFSSEAPLFPAAVAVIDPRPDGATSGPFPVAAGPALAYAIEAAGFAINARKIRIQSPHQRQAVTGVTVNAKVNVQRSRVRRLRAMLHAWEKHGIEAAAREHLLRWRHEPKVAFSKGAAKRFRASVYGELAYLKMVRGSDDPLFLKLCGRLVSIDPNPSKFLRQMVFGANDFDIFISHATEDKPEIARPLRAACERRGLKVFLDEEHIAWGESFTKKINTALGAARTILCVVSSNSVAKPWPLAEVNAALDLEISGHKNVLVVLVGKPDLSKLPLVRAKNYHVWDGNADAVAAKLVSSRGRAATGDSRPHKDRSPPSAVPVGAAAAVPAEGPTRPTAEPGKRRSWLWLFRRSG